MSWVLALLPVCAAAVAATGLGPDIQELVASRRFAEARELCRHELARNPADVEHAVYAARLSAWMGEYHTSIDEYDAALALSPGNVEALTGKAQVHIYQKQFSEAEALLGAARAAEIGRAHV